MIEIVLCPLLSSTPWTSWEAIARLREVVVVAPLCRVCNVIIDLLGLLLRPNSFYLLLLKYLFVSAFVSEDCVKLSIACLVCMCVWKVLFNNYRRVSARVAPASFNWRAVCPPVKQNTNCNMLFNNKCVHTPHSHSHTHIFTLRQTLLIVWPKIGHEMERARENSYAWLADSPDSLQGSISATVENRNESKQSSSWEWRCDYKLIACGCKALFILPAEKPQSW